MTLELLNFSIVTPSKENLFSPISLSISKGDIVTVTGPSGIGKSTLIDAIGGFLDPYFTTIGAAKIDGTNILNIDAHKRNIGILFQDANLFPHLSVGQNIAFGLSAKLKGKSMRRNAVKDALAAAGLESFGERDPASLSGGQQTRVALMRTLLSDPEILLLDEPFSKLDQATKTDIQSFVFSHIQKHQIPTILVTHDPSEIKGKLLELSARF